MEKGPGGETECPFTYEVCAHEKKVTCEEGESAMDGADEGDKGSGRPGVSLRRAERFLREINHNNKERRKTHTHTKLVCVSFLSSTLSPAASAWPVFISDSTPLNLPCLAPSLLSRGRPSPSDRRHHLLVFLHSGTPPARRHTRGGRQLSCMHACTQSTRGRQRLRRQRERGGERKKERVAIIYLKDHSSFLSFAAH